MLFTPMGSPKTWKEPANQDRLPQELWHQHWCTSWAILEMSSLARRDGGYCRTATIGRSMSAWNTQHISPRWPDEFRKREILLGYDSILISHLR